MTRKKQKQLPPELSGSISQLFDFAAYPVLKYYLWEWLKSTVSGNFNTALEATEKEFILEFYEKLGNLLTAAEKCWIQEQNGKKTRLLRK